jgi:hypothetical protein
MAPVAYSYSLTTPSGVLLVQSANAVTIACSRQIAHSCIREGSFETFHDLVAREDGCLGSKRCSAVHKLVDQDTHSPHIHLFITLLCIWILFELHWVRFFGQLKQLWCLHTELLLSLLWIVFVTEHK